MSTQPRAASRNTRIGVLLALALVLTVVWWQWGRRETSTKVEADVASDMTVNIGDTRKATSRSRASHPVRALSRVPAGTVLVLGVAGGATVSLTVGPRR